VLIADDDESARGLLEEAVLQLGYDCRTARDGLEAWELHQAWRADIILSDWQMPRMDGLELCRRTRGLAPEFGYTYFILLTGHGDREHFARGIEAGADDYHAKPVDLDELRARLASANRVLLIHRKLAERNTELQRDSEASFTVARVDALTGIPNRLSMDEDLRELWSYARRYGHRYSVAMCDVDWFKPYNDRFGHLAGDEVLRRIAKALQDACRNGDRVYRYGGEEFVVLLSEQELPDAQRAMERIRAAVEGLAIPAARAGEVVTISVGVSAVGVADGAGPAQWLARADAALYRAKAQGRNRVEREAAPRASAPVQ
jgi:diguanylate cyclase (GGDEF)-like protein